MRTVNDVLASAVDASASFNSEAFLVDQVFSFDLQVIISGTPIGTMKLQGSSDPGTTGTVPTSVGVSNWGDVAGSTQSINGAGYVVYNYTEAPGFKWVRLVYTSSSGTGNVTIQANGKGA